MKEENWTIAIFFALILLSTGLRLLGSGAGLPYLWHPDEPILMTRVVDMLQEDRLDPNFYHYPSLLFYVHMLGTSVWYLLTAKAGLHPLSDLQTGTDTGLPFTISDPSLWAWERGLTALFGGVAVGLVYLTGRRLSGDRLGVLAALFLMFSPHHTMLSRFITVDVPTSAAVAATLLASVFVLKEGEVRHYVLAGVAAGLAMACKYTAVVGAVVPLMAWALSERRRLWPGVGMFVLMGLTLLVCEPWFILRPSRVLFDMAAEVYHYGGMEITKEQFRAEPGLNYLWRCTEVLLTEGFPGWLLLVIPAGIWSFKEDRQGVGLVALLPVTFLLFMARNKLFQDRNLTPVEPALALLCAWGGLSVVARWPRARMALVGVAVLPALWSLSLTVQRSLMTDGRVEVVKWAKQQPGMVLAVPKEFCIREESLEGLSHVEVSLLEPEQWAKSGATAVLGAPRFIFPTSDSKLIQNDLADRARDWFHKQKPLYSSGEYMWGPESFTINPLVEIYPLDAASLPAAVAVVPAAEPAAEPETDAATADVADMAVKSPPTDITWKLFPHKFASQMTTTSNGIHLVALTDTLLLACTSSQPVQTAKVFVSGRWNWEGTGAMLSLRFQDATGKPLRENLQRLPARGDGADQAFVMRAEAPTGAVTASLCLELKSAEGSADVSGVSFSGE